MKLASSAVDPVALSAHRRFGCMPRGFTLIELLVVIGLATLLGVTLAALLGGRGSQAASLRIAQNSVASLLGSARAQAALHQREARLLIYAAPPPTNDTARYLRYLLVVRKEDDTALTPASRWISVGTPVVLPTGIYVVPLTLSSQQLAGITWTFNGAAAPFSQLGSAPTLTVDTQNFGQALYVEFGADGRPTQVSLSDPTPQIVIAPAQAAANSFPKFDNPAALRGVIVRASGAFAFVADPTSF